MLKIQDARNLPTSFGELHYGDVFHVAGKNTFFMCVNDIEDYDNDFFNAVDLSCGLIVYFASDAIVTPVNAVLKIT